MPRASQRKRYLRFLEQTIIELLPLWRRQIVKKGVRQLCLLHHAISSTRYLDRPSQAQQTHVLPGIYGAVPIMFVDDTCRHYEAFCVTTQQLDDIVARFDDYPGFWTGSRKPQAPPKYQFGVLLYRMAHGHGVRQIARTFGVAGEPFPANLGGTVLSGAHP
jgi:hypothetical protein